jgi:hypothetical protein
MCEVIEFFVIIADKSTKTFISYGFFEVHFGLYSFLLNFVYIISFVVQRNLQEKFPSTSNVKKGNLIL